MNQCKLWICPPYCSQGHSLLPVPQTSARFFHYYQPCSFCNKKPPRILGAQNI